VERSETVMLTGAEGAVMTDGAMAVMVLDVHAATTAGTPLMVTRLPRRKPVPVMVMKPPEVLTAAGETESA